MNKKFLVFPAILLAIALIAGCADDEATTTDDTNTISGIATKGPINLATVSVYKLNEDGTRSVDPITTTTTSSDGFYSIAVSYSGAVELVVTGGSYTDEATGNPVTLSSSDEMKTLLASVSASTSAAITPLTTIAAAHANENAVDGLAIAISNANNAVAVAFGLSGIDITTQKPCDLTSTGSSNQSDSAKQYGSVLAGLSQVAMENNVDHSEVLTLVKAMADDFKDGDFDGSNGETALTFASAITPEVAQQGLAQAMQNFLDNTDRNKSGFTSNDAPTVPASGSNMTQ